MTPDEILGSVEAENRATVERLAREWRGLDEESVLGVATAILDAVEEHGPRIVRLAIALSGVL